VQLGIRTRCQSLADPRHQPCGATGTRGRVDDDHGSVGHATDCAV
jgi:hypothetical protein